MCHVHQGQRIFRGREGGREGGGHGYEFLCILHEVASMVGLL